MNLMTRKPSNYTVIGAIWAINLLLLIALYIFISQNRSNVIFQPAIEHTETTLLAIKINTPAKTQMQHRTETVKRIILTSSPTPHVLNTIEISPTIKPSLTPIPIKYEKPQPFNSPLIIGYSVEGRPLEVCIFGTGKVGRMIIAGIHGGYEGNTIALADALIEDLQQNRITIPTDITIYILRSLNPDGEAVGNSPHGRANAHNVDLNRNWDAYWQAEPDQTGCWNLLQLSAGKEPFSEPETHALKVFLEQHPDIDALISYHSASLGIFPGGRPPDPLSVSLATNIASISPYPYPPIDTGCTYTGQLIDWASDQGIAAVDIELNDHVSMDYEINLAILDVFFNWVNPNNSP